MENEHTPINENPTQQERPVPPNQGHWEQPNSGYYSYRPAPGTQNEYFYNPHPQPQPQFQSQPQPQKTQKEKKPRSWGGVIALLLVCCLVSSLLGAATTAFVIEKRLSASNAGSSNIQQGDRENSVISIHEVDTSKQMTQAEVYASNVNSTVGITTSVTTNFWGYQTTSAASGSGFIYSDDGYILTNYHVVEDSDSIKVAFYDGTTLPAELVGYDENNDIAVLKVEAQNLTPVVLGDSDNINVGDPVLAIGNPLGELTFSLTSGSVSALDRKITLSGGLTMNLIQTDCAINSGNSGGALFNLYGEVVGITNAKYSGSSMGGASIDNIAFAIPINQVRSIVDSIIEKGYISKPYMGVSVSNVSADAIRFGLPQGAAIQQVNPDSPAEKAGLRPNDIITHLDGKEITSANGLIEAIEQTSIGQEIAITVYRAGQSVSLQLTMGEYIQPAIVDNTSNKP